jgi:hypothetical protein
MRFVKESVFDASVEEVFAVHERPDILELLQPPWEHMRVVRPPTSLEVGTIVEMKSRLGPFWVTIVAEHVAYEKNVLFEDKMIRGPFRKWHHRHLFSPAGQGCRLRDEIDYELPLGALGRLVEPFAVRPRLQRLFDYRHEVTRNALGRR